MNDPKAPQDFAGWNEQMIQRHDPEIFYRHPFRVVRWVETMRVKAVIRALDLRPECVTLDVGCGAGSLLEQLTCRALYGVDLSPTMVRRALDRLSSDVTVLQADAEALPFEDGTFDRVVASSLMSHVLNPDKVLSELRRVTKKGGRIVISISDEAQIERGMRCAKSTGWQRFVGGEGVSETQSAYHVDYHLQRFSLKRLRVLVGDSLEELNRQRVPFFFPVHWVVAYGR